MKRARIPAELRQRMSAIVRAARRGAPAWDVDQLWSSFADQCEAAARYAGANWRDRDRPHRIRALPDVLERRLARVGHH